MRRSTKASQLISQSGSDETYKFRCMEYMNFVLDQLLSDDTKFKLYFTHIENLIRNNLNDLTIQDIERIKRMLEEGEKLKPDTQQTGEFINYDLIEKQKYTLKRTHFYLEQGPSQALLHLEGFNPYTMHEAQLAKNEYRMERLQERNYSMLDTMFKLPEVEKKYQDQLEKEYELKMGLLEGENQEFQFEKFNTQKINVQKIPQLLEPNQNLHAQNVEDNDLQEAVNKNDNKTQQKKVSLTPQKSKYSILEQSVEMAFVDIKKKTKRKKPQNPVLQKPAIIASQQPVITNLPKPEVQSQMKPNPEQFSQLNPQPNAEQKESNDNKNDTEQNGKRKYVRKKPLEPKPPKPEKQKPPRDLKKPKSKPEQNKVEMLQQIQSNIEFALLSQAAELTNLLGAELLNVGTDDNHKQKPLPEQLAIKDLIKKQSKSKRVRKPESQQKSDSKRSKKQNNSKQLQIMLPYPNCEQEVNRLKVQVESLHKKLEQEKLQFKENRQHALNMITVAKGIQEERIQSERIQQERINSEKIHSQNIEKIVPIVEELKVTEFLEPKPQEESLAIDCQKVCQTPQQLVQEIQSIAMRQKFQEQLPKKPKHLSKILPNKKLSPSSEQYKPVEQQISQSEVNGDSKEGDYYQPGKQKKIKKKQSTTKKRSKKQSTKSDKEKSKSKSIQKIQRISQDPACKPSQSFISVDTESKEKKVKLTPEQREKIQIQREKLKEMRLKEKEERSKLKELQKLQRQVLKLKKVDKSQKSSKSQKLSEKHRNNSISQVNQSSSLVVISVIHEEKKQTKSSTKKNNEISHQIHQKQAQINEKSDQKNPLNISNGNTSTKQDISLSFVSLVGIQKSLIDQVMNEVYLPVIEQSQKIELQKPEDFKINNQDEIKEKQPMIVGIPPIGSFSAFFKDHIASWEEGNAANQVQQSGSPKRQKSLGEVDPAQKVQIEQKPKKKIKLACKQSYVFEDPQYGIDNPSQQKQIYTIQVFERKGSKKADLRQLQQQLHENSHMVDQQKDNQLEDKGYIEQQNADEEQENSSSLSADDD